MVAIVGTPTSNGTTTGTTSSLALSWPTGTAAGDLAYMCGTIGAGAAVIQGPSTGGWTQVILQAQGSTSQLGVWYKRLTAADVAGAIAISVSAGRQCLGAIIVLRGGVHSAVSAVDIITLATVGTYLTLTPNGPDAYLLGFCTGNSTLTGTSRTDTPPGGWTERVDISDTHASNKRQQLVLDTLLLSGGNGTPTSSATHTFDGTVNAQSMVVAVRPESTQFFY